MGWFAMLVGCGGAGTWRVETWGEEYIEEGIPAAVFADGCSVKFDRFEVAFASRTLHDGDGAEVGALTPGAVFDLTEPGPTPMGEVEVPADHYSDVRVTVAAVDGAPAVSVAGTLSCPGGVVTFDWVFDESTTYDCVPDDLTVPANGADDTQLTVHGDHLFYDGLENDDAEVRGEALVAADADGDGAVTLAELEAVSIPALGYQVGPFADALDLRAFVAHLSRTVVHVDGEGECLVDF